MNCKTCEAVKAGTAQAENAFGVCAMRPELHEVDDEGRTTRISFGVALTPDEGIRLCELQAQERNEKVSAYAKLHLREIFEARAYWAKMKERT